MKELLLIGGGGHCKSIIDVIEEEGSFSIAGIIDKSDLLGETVLGNSQSVICSTKTITTYY